MFLALGLLIFPSDDSTTVVEGTLLALVVTFIARPIATSPSTAFGGFIVRGEGGTRLGRTARRSADRPRVFPVNARDPGQRSTPQQGLLRRAGLDPPPGDDLRAAGPKLGLTTSEPALPSPIAETGIRRLGAEVVEYPVREDDAIVGPRTRELELPREALVNVIVRDSEAILPRGSTRSWAATSCTCSFARRLRPKFAMIARWRRGPIGPEAAPPRPRLAGASRVFHVRPWSDEDGDASLPESIDGLQVIDGRARGVMCRAARAAGGRSLRGRRAAMACSGSRQALNDWVRRRMRPGVADSERVWWEEVLARSRSRLRSCTTRSPSPS